jgi:carbon-monoxide dehydrogenase large subunit
MTTPLVVPPCHALARDIVRYVGEPVAFVVAESTEAARDAAEAVIVDYAPLPPVVAIADAVLPDAPAIWPEARGNIAFQFNAGEIGPVEAAIRDAAHVVECELVNNRVVAAPMETRGALGEFDASTGRLHLTASAAGAHAIRDLLADGVFRIGREKLRVSIPDVGGGFGMKNVLYPSGCWCCGRRVASAVRSRGSGIAARILQARSMVATASFARASRWIETAASSRSDTKVLANLGAYVSTVAPAVPTMAMASAMGGVYDIPLIAFQASGVFTNTTPVDAYRGAGKPEANYLIERCVDIAAHQLGMDALKLRRKNIFRRFPHQARWGLRSSRAALATRSITRSRPPPDSMRAGAPPASGASCGAWAMPAFWRRRADSPMRWRKCVSATTAGST